MVTPEEETLGKALNVAANNMILDLSDTPLLALRVLLYISKQSETQRVYVSTLKNEFDLNDSKISRLIKSMSLYIRTETENNNDSKKPLNYFTITPRGKYLLEQIVKVYQ